MGNTPFSFARAAMAKSGRVHLYHYYVLLYYVTEKNQYLFSAYTFKIQKQIYRFFVRISLFHSVRIPFA